MGRMEKESGGFCFVEVPVTFCKSYSFFLPSLISISCICVKYLSLPYPSFLSFRLFGGGVLLFYPYLFVFVDSDFPLFHVGYDTPLSVFGGVCPWVYISNTCHLLEYVSVLGG